MTSNEVVYKIRKIFFYTKIVRAAGQKSNFDVP